MYQEVNFKKLYFLESVMLTVFKYMLTFQSGASVAGRCLSCSALLTAQGPRGEEGRGRDGLCCPSQPRGPPLATQTSQAHDAGDHTAFTGPSLSVS